jgi:hypothetical protein
MCGCKDCQGITLFKGKDGRGIVSITAQEDGTFIYLYTDGTTYISPDLTGPEGPPGSCAFVEVVGENDIVVTENTVGLVTTYTVGRPKEFFYAEVPTGANVDDGTFAYHFPVGYTGLIYTNGTLVSKSYLVQGSYDTSGGFINNSSAYGNWVEGAIIKTVLAIDTVQWESSSQINLSINLFNGPNGGDVVDEGTTDYVVDNLGNHVETRFSVIIIPSNVCFFKYLTLAPGESVSLQFKAKPGEVALLRKAQFVVQEM